MVKDLEELDLLKINQQESLKAQNKITQSIGDKQAEEERVKQFRNNQESTKLVIVFSH